MEKQLLAGKYPANIDIDKVQFLSVCCKWGTHKYEPPHFKHAQTCSEDIAARNGK